MAVKKINVNAASPSMIDTKFLSYVHAYGCWVISGNRNAVVGDVVPMIKFLLSDESKYITGQNIVISGGSVI